MHTEIVSFSPSHFPAYTALWNEAYPDLQRSELELRLSDLAFAPSKPQRWMVQREHRIVAFAEYQPGEQPGQLQLHLFVSPAYRQQGIGSKLYEHAARELSSKAFVQVWVREDCADALTFLPRRGFREQMRTFHSYLNTEQFELARLEKFVKRLERNGYELRSFAELAHDAERNRKCHELHCEVMRDVPAPTPPKLPTFAEYESRILNQPEYFAGQFWAVLRGEYVGQCILLRKGRKSQELYADTLGVKRGYRGRGIAQALSYSGISYAKSRGYMRISADSFVENHRIAALLEDLGFGDRRVWTLLVNRD